MRTIIRLLIRLGLLAAVGFVIRKIVRGLRSDESVEPSTPWPPLEDRSSGPSGAASTTAPVRSVTMERAEADTTTRSAMATTKKAAAKKTAARKAPAKKAAAKKAPAKKVAAAKKAPAKKTAARKAPATKTAARKAPAKKAPAKKTAAKKR